MYEEEKMFLKNLPSHTTPNTKPSFFPAQTIVLIIMVKIMVGYIFQKIKLYLQGPGMENHIQYSLKTTDKAIQITEWKVIEVALSKTDPLTHISRKKIIHR